MLAGRFRVEALGDQHARSGFASGAEALDRYFRQQIGQDVRRRVAAAFVLIDTDENAVAGFYTLSATSILARDLPADLVKRLPRYPALPAFLIGRLAVDGRYRGQGLGGVLLIDALWRCAGTVEIGAIGAVVDAKDDAARAFYERHGFLRLAPDSYRLILPMASIPAR